MKKVLALFSLELVFLSSCAIGPLVSHDTARTVGKSNHELIGGYGDAGYAFKWNYGLNDNLDFGLHLESLSIGLRAKYAFINNKEGWSFATALGTGSSLGGSHYYGDIVGSYLVGSWEPYGTIRLVHVTTDPLELKDTDTGQINFVVASSEYNYGQFMIGTRYWLNQNWLLSVEASSLFTDSSDFDISKGIIAGAALGYRY